MALRMVVLVCVVTLFLGVVSCEKLPELRGKGIPRQLKTEPLKSLDAIPAEFGNVVGVTSDSSRPAWAQLWLEKPDKTIVVVWVNYVDGGLGGDYLLIPRR